MKAGFGKVDITPRVCILARCGRRAASTPGEKVSTLFLIRHGQASYGAADYDVDCVRRRAETQEMLVGPFLVLTTVHDVAVVRPPRPQLAERPAEVLP